MTKKSANRSASKSALQHVKTMKMPQDATDALGVLGGIVAGRFISKQLDNIIRSTPVAGLLGVEMTAKAAKYVKPAIVAAVGIGAYQVGTAKKQNTVKMVGLGIGAVGLGDIASAIMNRNVLAGDFLGETLGLGNNTEADYQIIDTETGKPISGTTIVLPSLGYEDDYGLPMINTALYGNDKADRCFSGNSDDDDFSGYEDEQDFSGYEDEQDFSGYEDEQDFSGYEDEQDFSGYEDEILYGTENEERDFFVN